MPLRARLTAAAVILSALLLRLPFMATEGFQDDLFLYAEWAWKIDADGLETLYEPTEGVAADNHPGHFYALKAVGSFYRLLRGDFPRTAVYDPLLRFLLRLPAVFFDFLIAAALFAWLRKKRPESALPAAALFLFNPAVIFDSAAYGQIDSIHSFFALTAFLLLDLDRTAVAGFALGLAAMQKPQSDVLLPLFAFACGSRLGLKETARAGIGALSAALLIAAPFLVHGTFPGLVSHFTSITEVHPVLSVNAHNLWWLLYRESAFSLPDAALFNLRAVGLVLMMGGLSPLWYASRRENRPPELFLLVALSVFVFFMTATQMHENYLYLALPFLAAAAPLDSRAWRLYAFMSASFFFNMALHYPALIGSEAAGPLLSAARWLLAALNAAALALSMKAVLFKTR